MKIVETTFERLPRERLEIGFEGENLRATVRIDCASVFAEYPNATPALIVKPLFADAYPVVVDRNGTDVDWLITSEILSFNGDGEIQLIFYKDQVICKSAVSKIRVSRSLTVTGEMPDPVVQWIENANRKLAEVDAQITELEGMVDTATDAATRAEQSASTASTKAEQAAGSAATATEKATEATNAAGTATAKAAEAEQSAQTATNKANAAAESERIATAKAGEATTAAETATAKAEQATEAAETATEKAGDASASATAAQASATDAASSATAASASETAAKASETAAGASATQAAQSAQTANTAAQTATQKAEEAASSATNAATYATNAATSAETASTKAGEAAQSAQTVEQTAEQLADSLEQISQNTADIAEHEQEYNALKESTLIHSTASGSIASFSDGAEMPVDEVTAQINPVQDLHGYDSPWPAGGGKNKFDYQIVSPLRTENGITYTINDDGSVTLNGTATNRSQIYWHMEADDVRQFSGMLLDCFPEAIPGVAAILEEAGGEYTSYAVQQSGTSTPVTIDSSIDGNETYANLIIRVTAGTTINNIKVYPMIRPAGSQSGYAPYSNICPITGWDGVKVTRTGVNVWDEEWELGGISLLTGENTTSTNRIRSKNFIPVRPGETYCFNLPWVAVCAYDINKHFIASGQSDNRKPLSFPGCSDDTATHPRTWVIPAGVYYIRFHITTTYGTEYKHDSSINYPATNTAYHSFTGATTISINLPTEAGTVYGGTLDVTTGELVVDRAVVDLASLVWTPYGTVGTNRRVASNNLPNVVAPSANNVIGDFITEKYKTTIYSALNYLDFSQIAMSTAGALVKGFDDVNYPTGNICYKLAAPITYTLTASEIRTLLGTNNVWSDAGDVSVKYNADTKLYIDGKIAELVAQIVNS